ncbi:MAG: hypothetical protein NTZ19_00135 [Bacteroidetes bacterium]|nr:hypothetical protein [Bacteroidota bacterium]
MNRKKTMKFSVIVTVIASLIAGTVVFYLFNQPKRDVQATKTDFRFTASQLVTEYLVDAKKANAKYLNEDGNSKVLEISGMVANISENYNKQKVLLLKFPADSAGVSCTIISVKDPLLNQIKLSEDIIVKGVIRSGASYDKDLGMYENVIMDNCKIISTKQ